MSLSYSITLSSFLNIEDINITLEKLSDVGFTQLEMFGEPDEIYKHEALTENFPYIIYNKLYYCKDKNILINQENMNNNKKIYR
jgi:hypothetical protein